MSSRDWQVWTSGFLGGLLLGATYHERVLKGANRLFDALDLLLNGRPPFEPKMQSSGGPITVHGTVEGYREWGGRCPHCRAAWDVDCRTTEAK